MLRKCILILWKKILSAQNVARIRVLFKFERPSQNSYESVKCDKNKLDCDINCTLSQYAKTILLKNK